MDASARETIPQAWDDALDLPFFRITARLFAAEFCVGATAMLASNDERELARAQSSPSR